LTITHFNGFGVKNLSVPFRAILPDTPFQEGREVPYCSRPFKGVPTLPFQKTCKVIPPPHRERALPFFSKVFFCGWPPPADTAALFFSQDDFGLGFPPPAATFARSTQDPRIPLKFRVFPPVRKDFCKAEKRGIHSPPHRKKEGGRSPPSNQRGSS